MACHTFVTFTVISVSLLSLLSTAHPSASVHQREPQRSASFSYNQNGIAADVYRKSAINGVAHSRIQYGDQPLGLGAKDSLLASWWRKASAWKDNRISILTPSVTTFAINASNVTTGTGNTSLTLADTSINNSISVDDVVNITTENVTITALHESVTSETTNSSRDDSVTSSPVDDLISAIKHVTIKNISSDIIIEDVSSSNSSTASQNGIKDTSMRSSNETTSTTLAPSSTSSLSATMLSSNESPALTTSTSNRPQTESVSDFGSSTTTITTLGINPVERRVTSPTSVPSIEQASDRADIDSEEEEVEAATGSGLATIFGDRRRDTRPKGQSETPPPDTGAHVFKIPEFPPQDSQKIAESLRGQDNTELFRSLYETQPDAPRYANPETVVPLNVYGLPPKFRFKHPVGNVEEMEPPRVPSNEQLPGPVVDHAVRRGSGYRDDDYKFARLYDLHPDTQGFAHPDKEVPLNIFGLPPKFRYNHPLGHVNGSPPKIVYTNAYLSGPVTDVIEDLPKLSMVSSHPPTHSRGTSGGQKPGDNYHHQSRSSQNMLSSQSQHQPQVVPPPSHPFSRTPEAHRRMRMGSDPFEVPHHLPSGIRSQMENIFKSIQDAVDNVQSHVNSDNAKDTSGGKALPGLATSSAHSTELNVQEFQTPLDQQTAQSIIEGQDQFQFDLLNNKGTREIPQHMPPNQSPFVTQPEQKHEKDSAFISETSELMQTQQSIQSDHFQSSKTFQARPSSAGATTSGSSNHPFAKYSQGPIRYVDPELIEPIKVSNMHTSDPTSSFDLASVLDSMLSPSPSRQSNNNGNRLQTVSGDRYPALDKHRSKHLLPIDNTETHQQSDSESRNIPSNVTPNNAGKLLKATLLQTLTSMMELTKRKQTDITTDAGHSPPSEQSIQSERRDVGTMPNEQAITNPHMKNTDYYSFQTGDTTGSPGEISGKRTFIYRRPPLDHTKIILNQRPNNENNEYISGQVPTSNNHNHQYEVEIGEKPNTEQYIFKAHDDAYKNQNGGGHDNLKNHHPDNSDTSTGVNHQYHEVHGDTNADLNQIYHFESQRQKSKENNDHHQQETGYRPSASYSYSSPTLTQSHYLPQQEYYNAPAQSHHNQNQQEPNKHMQSHPHHHNQHHQYDQPRRPRPPVYYPGPHHRPPPHHMPHVNNYGYQRPRGILDLLFPKLIQLGVNLGLTKELIFQKSDRRHSLYPGEPEPLPKITLRLGLKKNIDAKLAL